MSLALEEIIECFHACFLEKYHTRIVGGFEEPFYLAPNGDKLGEIQFRADYSRSALHEVAHWCVAGHDRRQLDDFGYWYRPEGRNIEQQKEFFLVEIKPQAYEWIFCEAAGLDFEISVDNLEIDMSLLQKEQAEFEAKVFKYKELTLTQAPTNQKRVMTFAHALKQFHDG